MINIDKNYNFFSSIRDELVKKNKNKFVVISGESVKDFFDDEGTAYRFGVENFKLGNFIIQKCVSEEEEIQRFHSRVSFNN